MRNSLGFECGTDHILAPRYCDTNAKYQMRTTVDIKCVQKKTQKYFEALRNTYTTDLFHFIFFRDLIRSPFY